MKKLSSDKKKAVVGGKRCSKCGLNWAGCSGKNSSVVHKSNSYHICQFGP